MINELDLDWVPNFTGLGIYFVIGTKVSWNEGIDTCFNVEVCYFAEILIFLVVTWWLLLFTTGYYSLLLVPTFSMNDYFFDLTES